MYSVCNLIWFPNQISTLLKGFGNHGSAILSNNSALNIQSNLQKDVWNSKSGQLYTILTDRFVLCLVIGKIIVFRHYSVTASCVAKFDNSFGAKVQTSFVVCFFYFYKLSIGKTFICKVERLNVKQRRSRWDGSLLFAKAIIVACGSESVNLAYMFDKRMKNHTKDSQNRRG